MAIYKARREVLEETNPANTLISLLASGTRIITLLFRQLILGGSRKIETGKVTSKPHSSALPNTSPRDICLPVSGLDPSLKNLWWGRRTPRIKWYEWPMPVIQETRKRQKDAKLKAILGYLERLSPTAAAELSEMTWVLVSGLSACCGPIQVLTRWVLCPQGSDITVHNSLLSKGCEM